MGPEAAETINLFALAINAGMTAKTEVGMMTPIPPLVLIYHTWFN
ncbi:MAG: hypothetical protein U5L96_06855 [Owenweeksia sp.]|nr:hypothetical protein [Owenweeksia sp.]